MSRQYAPDFSIKLGGTELRHGASLDVLSVSVIETSDRADTFSISLRDRNPERGRFAGGASLKWLDDSLLDEGTEVEIELGYVGDMRLMMVGRINGMTPSFPESGLPTLAVRGFSLQHDLQRLRCRKPFKASTDSGIAKEIAQAMGLSAKVDETKAENPLVSANGASYAAILKQRAERLGYEVAVKQRTLYFQKPRYLAEPSPKLTLEWGRDLRSFSPRLTTHGLVTEVLVRGPQTSRGGDKTPIVGSAKAGEEQVKLGSTAASEIAKAKFGETQEVYDDHNVASQEEANAMALAQLQAKSMGFITGRGSCVGDPRLEARTIIELKGLGQRFSGRYYVTSVTHTIDGSGYRSDFDVRRNG